MLFGLLGRPAWQWRRGSHPTPDQLAEAAAALRRRGSKAGAQRAAVAAHLAAAVDPSANGSAAVAAATVTALCSSDLLEAVAEAVRPEAAPAVELVEAAAELATRLAAASPVAASAVADSGLVGALAAYVRAPAAAAGSPDGDAKIEALACLRATASRAAVREAMEAEGAPAAVVAALRAGTEGGDWVLAGHAAWALELMGGMSRRLSSAIGEAGGVEAALELLEAARRQQPALRELPRDEDAADAAGAALHALLALLADNRRSRVRLRRANGGGSAELAAAFQDDRLGWEAREQAAGLLQDLAATLAQDGMAAAGGPGAAAGAAGRGDNPPSWAAPAGGSSHLSTLGSPPGTDLTLRPGASSSGSSSPYEAEWRQTLLPSLAAVMHQRRGQQLEESKEAAAGILAKFAANGPEYAAAVGEANALPPLVQLLHGGRPQAGGQMRAALAALQALGPLVCDPGCQKQLVGPCVSASGQLDLLAPLLRLLASDTAPELNLLTALDGSSDSSSMGFGGAGSSGASPGGLLGVLPGGEESQLVAAGWLAASVAARLCGTSSGTAVQRQQQLQDAAVARGLLPMLSRFLLVDAPVGAAAGAAAFGEDSRAAEQMAAIQCEVAGLLRSISMRRAHHAALRGCPRLLPRLRALLVPGAAGWVELKAGAKKILQNLGELADTDRPLLTYTPHQLAALLEGQGIQASRFVERGVTGAEFARLTDGELAGLALPGQQGRVQRVLRAFETFSEIDGCGPRTGSVGLAKLAAYLSARGFRQAEVVPLAESLVGLMDADRDDAASFPDFLQAYDEFVARTNVDLQPPSKRRRTESQFA